MRFNKLPDIFNRYATAQSELELSDDKDHSGDGELFENQYYQVEAKFNELLHPVVDPPLSRHIAACQDTAIILHGHMRVAHISSYQLLLCQPLKVTHVDGYISETREELIVYNTTLSSVQKFHYLIASLNEAKDLISNLQITNENFLVAWQLVTQQMINCHDACQAFMPNAPNQKGRRIITASINSVHIHVSSHMNV